AATHGGTVHRLDTVTEEEAQQLLVNLLGTERVAHEPDAAHALAHVCGYFPLSLRIAAAHLTTRPHLGIGECVRWLSADLLARLHLTDEPQVSVSRTFESALLRLSPELRTAFLLLASAHHEDSGESPPTVPEDVLEQLGDAGFVEEGPPAPYRVHSLLKVYARQHLAASDFPGLPPL
ncbi:AfsR family transcriptional regulator, partial [Streptomyces sp. NPDC051098]